MHASLSSASSLLLSSPITKLSLKIPLTCVEAHGVDWPVHDLKGLDQILKNGIALNLGIEVVSNLVASHFSLGHNPHFVSECGQKLFAPKLFFQKLFSGRGT